MSDTTDKEGLTKPLKNNIGGVIDQDAPSADQLLEGRSNKSWGSEPVETGDQTLHDDRQTGLADAVIPMPNNPGDRIDTDA